MCRTGRISLTAPYISQGTNSPVVWMFNGRAHHSTELVNNREQSGFNHETLQRLAVDRMYSLVTLRLTDGTVLTVVMLEQRNKQNKYRTSA